MITNILLSGAGNTSSIIWLVVLVVMIVVMLVLPSVTQKKRVKAYQEMQSRLKAGDKVQTIGGIVGKIVRIKESNGVKTIFVETGDKNSKMVIEFDANAIAGVVEGINPQPAQTEARPVETEAEVVNVGIEDEATETEEAPKTEKPATKKKSASKAKK